MSLVLFPTWRSAQHTYPKYSDTLPPNDISQKNLTSLTDDLGPAVQSIISLTSLLMTNLYTVVAKVFSNTLIFLLQKCE